MHVVVDAANVVGSRPDGWWRDRPGAARRLVDAVAGALAGGRLDPPVTVVLEGAARAGVEVGPVTADTTPTAPADADPVPTGSATDTGSGWLEVLHAARDGDAAIATLTERLTAGGSGVVVVTADRDLRARVAVFGARTVGPGWLRDRL